MAEPTYNAWPMHKAVMPSHAVTGLATRVILGPQEWRVQDEGWDTLSYTSGCRATRRPRLHEAEAKELATTEAARRHGGQATKNVDDNEQWMLTTAPSRRQPSPLPRYFQPMTPTHRIIISISPFHHRI